jgi:type IV secretory pathway VirJ component
LAIVRNVLRSVLCTAAACALVSAACSRTAAPPPPDETLDGGRLGALRLWRPDDPPEALVFLFSDAGGVNPALDRLAADLRDDGAAVLEVDLPQYLKQLRESDDGCHYLISAIEALSQRVQRELGGRVYHTPILAGVGEGGTLAYAALAQSPAATVAGAVSVDPAASLDTKVPLCPGAPARQRAVGYGYGAKADLPGWWIVSSRVALPDDLAKIANKPDVEVSPDASPLDRLESLVEGRLEAGEAPPGLRDLPLTVLEPPDYDASKPAPFFAIIYSGDGGWRDIDKEIGEKLASEGIPVVGVDSLRYFWTEKTPTRMGSDLAAMIDAYSDRWGTDHLVLVGYSFGAAVLPFAIDALPPEARDQVVEVSLLGLADRADFEIQVQGWLGAKSNNQAPLVLPVLQKLDLSRVQCFYGEEEDDTICPDPALRGAEIVKTSGGHHFGGDYEALAQRIYDGAQRRIERLGRSGGSGKPSG